MKKLLKRVNLKDAGFVISLYVFLTTLFLKGVAFANPCVPGEPCTGLVADERSIFLDLALAVIFNAVIDSIVLFLTVFLILKIRATGKVYLVSLLLMVIVGFVADYLGLFAADRIVSYDMYGLTVFGIVGLLIAVGDFFISRSILKVNNKKALVIAIAMAILTNPALWSKILG